MARRYINSLEKPSHRRARFRRGFAFGFLGLSALFAVAGWALAVANAQIALFEAQTVGVWAIPLAIAGAAYGAAIVIGETNRGIQLERIWLGLMSVLYVIAGFWLIFVGTLYLLDTFVSN